MDDVKNQAISDDQELAKVLQGMQQQTRTMATHDPSKDEAADPAMQYEEMPAPSSKTITPPSASDASAPAAPASTPAAPEAPAAAPTPAPAPEAPAPAAPAAPSDASAPATNPALESLKKEALEELRPLVTKLDLPAKEKFDTLLLIIRSTDDQSLLDPAHDAAKAIEDETERAEALLDIVKEIDYFASQK